MKSELLEIQIAFIFMGAFLSFIGLISKTQNAGDMINGFNSKKHDKEKVSKIFGNNFLVAGLCILVLISTTFVFENINIGILKTIIMAVFVIGVIRTMYQIEKYGKITPKK